MPQPAVQYKVKKFKNENYRMHIFAEDEDFMATKIVAVNRERRLVRCACSDGQERELPVVAVLGLKI